MWIIERKRGRVSETTWLLLTNAIWLASSASRTDAFARLFVHFAYVEKRRKERETIGQPNRTDARCQKDNALPISVPNQYLFRDQIIREQIGTRKTDFLFLSLSLFLLQGLAILRYYNVFNDKLL